MAAREVDDHDTPAEVDATFRTLRRVSFGYFALFLAAITGVPALTLSLGWWSEGRLIGGMSPGFVMAAFGLYIFFFLIGIAAATLSTAVEGRMLGGPAEDDPTEDYPPDDYPAEDYPTEPYAAGAGPVDDGPVDEGPVDEGPVADGHR